MLAHQALVQIYFSWSVSFFLSSGTLYVVFIPCRFGRRSVLSWCDPPLLSRSNPPLRRRARILSRHLRMLPFSSCLFPPSLALRHRFLPICPVVGLVPFLRAVPTYTEARCYLRNQATASPESFPLLPCDGRPTCLLA